MTTTSQKFVARALFLFLFLFYSLAEAQNAIIGDSLSQYFFADEAESHVLLAPVTLYIEAISGANTIVLPVGTTVLLGTDREGMFAHIEDENGILWYYVMDENKTLLGWTTNEELDKAFSSIKLDSISGGASKAITATPGKTSDRAIVRAFEKTENVWTLCFTAEGFFGGNGVKKDKREGDKATPSGVYTFGRAFGVADDPGSKLPYTKVTDLDVWVDDPNSKYYNQWALKNAQDADWNSAEHLIKYARAYKYALTINYNANPVVPGNGSAIFLHCSTGNPTAGCISVPEAAMIFFLGFVDEETRIAISGDGKF